MESEKIAHLFHHPPSSVNASLTPSGVFGKFPPPSIDSARTGKHFDTTMKRFSSLAIIAIILSAIVTSCVPYDEYGRPVDKKKNKQTTKITDPKQQEINAKREEMRLRDEQRRKELGLPPTESTAPNTGTAEANAETTKPAPQPPAVVTPPKNHPVAAAVPGKAGFVFSPFNNKVVDVRGIASGTLVADPQYPPADKKHFRVP
jgi:hypothetical protein